MNQSVTRLTLDVSVQEKQASISVRQFDTMRRLVFSMVDRGLPYIFEKGVYAAISVNTSPETAVFGGCVIQDGAVHYDLDNSLTLEPAEYSCDLILYASDHKVLTASSFDLIVFASNASDYASEAVLSNDFSAMVEATAEAKDAARNANEAAELARDAEEDAYKATQRADEISKTLEDKLAAGEFKGEKGDTGPQGPQGIQGEKGDPGEGIPEVTADDEGKILIVKDRKWVLAYPENASSGYTAISITSFGHNAGTKEYGESVTDVVLSWSLNKAAKTLTLDGEPLDVSATSKSLSGLNITFDNNVTWTLVATDERDAKSTRTTAIAFANGIYYGAAAEPAEYNSAFILGLTKTLQNSKVSPFTVDAGEGEYIYYALPKRLGTCEFTVGIFTGGFDLVATIPFENASGYTEDYYIYRSDNANLGSTTVSVA